LDKGLRHAELTLAAEQAASRYRQTGEVDSYAAALASLDEFRAQVEGDLVANMAFLAWAEGRYWDRALVKLMATPGTRLPDPWKFAWDPGDEGVQAGWSAAALDARDWRDIGTSSAWEEQPVGRQWQTEHGHDYDGCGDDDVGPLAARGGQSEGERRGHEGRLKQNRPINPRHAPDAVEAGLEEPLVVGRRPVGLSVGEQVRVGEPAVLEHPAAEGQMDPGVVGGHSRDGHAEAEGEGEAHEEIADCRLRIADCRTLISRLNGS